MTPRQYSCRSVLPSNRTAALFLPPFCWRWRRSAAHRWAVEETLLPSAPIHSLVYTLDSVTSKQTHFKLNEKTLFPDFTKSWVQNVLRYVHWANLLKSEDWTIHIYSRIRWENCSQNIPGHGEKNMLLVLLRQLTLASRPVCHVSITHSLYNYEEIQRHG